MGTCGKAPVSIWVLFVKRMKVLVCVKSGGARALSPSLARPSSGDCLQSDFCWIFSACVYFCLVEVSPCPLERCLGCRSGGAEPSVSMVI